MASNIHPVRVGAALSLTVGIGYSACSVLFWMFPEAAAGFMNALFHGLDFHKLQVEAGGFSFSGFVYALVGMMIWAFCGGILFGWIYALLSGAELARPVANA